MIKKIGASLKSVFFTDFNNGDTALFPQTLLISFLVCAPICTIFLWEKVPREIPIQLDGHSQLSLELAINRAICGSTSHLVQNNLLRAFLSQNKNAEAIPINQFPELLAGSREAYCQVVTIPFLNGENSLMLLELVFLKLIPGLSLSTLGLCLELVRFGCFFIFIVFLIRIGVSQFFSGILFLISLTLTNELYPSFYYSGYPFFLPMLLVFISAFGFLVSEGTTFNKWLASGLLFLLGLCAAFIVNLRTSYSLIVCLIFGVFLMFQGNNLFRIQDFSSLKKIYLLLLPLFIFFVGFFIFQKGIIDSISEVGVKTQYNYSHHPVAHPLVLGLAVPQNDFAEKEGIKWEDLVGLNLARKIDPEVTYLGPTYEKALLSYYINLWIFHQDEMFAVYQEKFKLAGRSIFDAFWSKDILLVKWLLWPFQFLKTGIAFLALYLTIFLVSLTLWSTKRISLGLAFLMISFCGASILLFLESAIIMPNFAVVYHACLSLWMFFLGLLFYQVILNLLVEFSLRLINQKD